MAIQISKLFLRAFTLKVLAGVLGGRPWGRRESGTLESSGLRKRKRANALLSARVSSSVT